jgi:phosphoglycerate dehydrogenase-like enzyme
MKSVLVGKAELLERVYGQGRWAAVGERTALRPEPVSAEALRESPEQYADVEVIFTTWGFPAFTPEQIERLKALKAIFYAAGSVQHFARPFLERGVVVASAYRANAVPVAEFVLGQILLANKGFFQNIQDCATPEGRAAGPRRGPGNFGRVVSLPGAGAVARTLIELLAPFEIRILVYDPFLTAQEAERLGVERVELDEAFARADVVSNHLPNKEQTKGFIGAAQLRQMPDHARFINTGRGAQVEEAALAEELERRPSLMALLDVTAPEPPAEDSPFYRLDNAVLSSHIAGSQGDEVVRLADAALEDFDAWRAGASMPGGVTLEMLQRMA